MTNEKTTRSSSKTNDFAALRKEYERPRVSAMRFDVAADTMADDGVISDNFYDAGSAKLKDDFWGDDE